jgi:hypothetical protein
VLPFSTTQLHTDLGLKGVIGDDGWAAEAIPAGTKLPAPKPLYAKIDTEPAAATA